jgi:hypothetical protein
MKHITPYEPMNESVPHNGIVLIKGKPRGKNKERMLYAGHVTGSAELRPGAVILFLSDQFYRIVNDNGRLKGIKINWRSEESLKDSLNLKSPGKISVVKNNTKTPYHWKTLKETSISQALDRVRGDLGEADYLFESSSVNVDLPTYERFLKAAVDSIFGQEKKVLVLGWTAKDASDLIEGSDSDDGHVTAEHSATIDFIYIEPSLVEELKRLGESTRAVLHIDISSGISFTSWYHPGDYMNPPEGDTIINGTDHTIEDARLNILGGEFMDETESISKMQKQIGSSLIQAEDLDAFLLTRDTKTGDKTVDFIKFFKI